MQRTLLWSGWVFTALFTLFGYAVFDQIEWLGHVGAALFITHSAALIYHYRKQLRTRSGAFGVYSLVLVFITFSILVAVNYISYNHPIKWDWTKNKSHTLNDQTTKFIKETKTPIKLVHFAKFAERESIKNLFEDIKRLNKAVEVEFVDPDKEPLRAKQAGIKKYNTLQIFVGARESKVEDPNEEKILNSVMKLSKESSPQVCAITGHGEGSFDSQEANGYSGLKKALEDQAYTVKSLSLLEAPTVPKECSALVFSGIAKALFPQEIKAIREYLAQGGRVVLSYELDPRQGKFPSGVEEILKDWYVKPTLGIIIDPVSRMLGVDMSMPVIATFSKENPITQDFQGQAFFPFSTPVEIMKDAPSSLKLTWLGKTTPKSMLINDLKQFATGEVKIDPGKVKQGPFDAAVAVDGKLPDSKAARNTRLVVFGSAALGNNNMSRFGLNLDFVANAISWVIEDESVISIRKKDEEKSTIEMSVQMGRAIFIGTVLIMPLAVALAGLIVWIRRRRL
jgi:ABC-type uncharacterized transport system involved in gliding motility auxiliary subunit